MSKILVTGATGFTGGWVLKKLAEEYGPDAVTGTGRSPAALEKRRAEGFQMIGGDLTDPEFVRNKLKNFEWVVHCAAKSDIWGYYDSFYRNNVVATKNLLDEIANLQKIIHISTPSIYFDFQDRFDVKESDPLPKVFVNHYTTTKHIAEDLILSYNKKNIFKIILRPRAIIGAGDTVILPRVIRAYNAGRLRIIGDGKNHADFTSVKNVAEAVSLSLRAGENSNNEIFNITDDDPKLLWEMMQLALKELGLNRPLRKVPYKVAYGVAGLQEWYHRMLGKGEPAVTRYGIGILKYSLTLNIDKAKNLLGYRPIISTEESLQEFVESYNDIK